MTKWQEALPLGRAMRVGLLGGSFDPAHEGHVHLSREALKRFQLDRIVWLVSPGNPLKPNPPAAMRRRIDTAQSIVQHPRIHISDFEGRHKSRYTYDTIRKLRFVWPDVQFVWLMGADNLAQFHKWENWRDIMETVPIGVLARPGLRLSARNSVTSRIYQNARLSAKQSRLLALGEAPRWCFVNMPMRSISSSAIRQSGNWRQDQK